MHLNAFTDYGLRILMRLAGNPEKTFSTSDLSREFSVSRHHLTKVAAHLAKEGYIQTRRGHDGGMTLAMAPEDIRIGDVVETMERDTPLVECFRQDRGNCTLTLSCQLAGRLAEAKKKFFEELNSTTLADIAYRIEVGRGNGGVSDGSKSS